MDSPAKSLTIIGTMLRAALLDPESPKSANRLVLSAKKLKSAKLDANDLQLSIGTQYSGLSHAHYYTEVAALNLLLDKAKAELSEAQAELNRRPDFEHKFRESERKRVRLLARYKKLFVKGSAK
jgi:hypothetical protein